MIRWYDANLERKVNTRCVRKATNCLPCWAVGGGCGTVGGAVMQQGRGKGGCEEENIKQIKELKIIENAFKGRL
jgi:hypothetical protein